MIYRKQADVVEDVFVDKATDEIYYVERAGSAGAYPP